MEKIIRSISFLLLFFSLSFFANAQHEKTITTATKNADGSIDLDISGPTEKRLILKAKDDASFQQMVLAEMQKRSKTETQKANAAVHVITAQLLPDGTQEILFLDSKGRQHTVTVRPGENVQEKYYAYLQKEGIIVGKSSERKVIYQTAVKE